MPVSCLAEYPPMAPFPGNSTQAGARAFSVAFEREADYVGAYYAARAGYELTGSEEIWRTFSLENPDSIRLTTDHRLRLCVCPDAEGHR